MGMDERHGGAGYVWVSSKVLLTLPASCWVRSTISVRARDGRSRAGWEGALRISPLIRPSCASHEHVRGARGEGRGAAGNPSSGTHVGQRPAGRAWGQTDSRPAWCGAIALAPALKAVRLDAPGSAVRERKRGGSEFTVPRATTFSKQEQIVGRSS